MMSEYIDRLKIKLVTAVDLKKGKINKKTDMYEALKELENFPMTLDILNSSRIGRIVNDIRHFDDTDPDIKSRLKHLIKQWNDKLLPNRNKKPSKPSNSNGCSKGVKVSDSTNIFHYNNENHKQKHSHSIQKTHKSSNNLEIVNGIKNNDTEDCDNSFEVPTKKIRLDNTNKKLYSDSPKNLLREIHLDSDSCPPTYKSNNLISQHKHDSPAVLHFSDVKTFIKREEEHNSSPSVNKDKQRKRKHDSSTNGVAATPLQKVKSTRELLAVMGDVVPSDTKKRILCNEIFVEDDLPKSCVPEAVRPKSKVIKTNKIAPESLMKVIKNSPSLLPNVDEEFTDYSNKDQVKVESFEPPIKLERNTSYSSFKENKINPLNLMKSSPFTPQNNSPFKTQLKSSPTTLDVHAQNIIATPTLSDDIDKSLKWKLKKPVKKKSKHPDPPITNRMDDLPPLPDLIDFQPDFSRYYYNSNDLASIELSDNIVELLAHLQWEGYNCSRQPISNDLLGYSDHYTVDHLHILAWTDTINECQSFFPVDTERELAWLESVIGEYS